MKVSVANITKAMSNKKIAIKGEASQPRGVNAKKPRVALRGLSTSAKAPPACQTRVPTIEKDDDEVEVILTPAATILVSSSTPIIPITIPKKLSASVRVKT